MMVLDRKTESIAHHVFSEFPRFLQPGDLVVLNDTRVLPARVFTDDGRVELLFLEQIDESAWRALVRPGKRARPGMTLCVGGVSGQVVGTEPDGERVLRFASALDLEKVGTVPLPPYLNREPEAMDRERYQTVYAREPGAVAAPTAGLHFTPALLERVPHAFVTLHVGVGTFRPVQAEDLTGHRMHAERFEISEETAVAVQRAGRVVAIGTTTVRVLESCAGSDGTVSPGRGSTEIFIHPPYRFRTVDVLLTNFHLPKSTLLMLVSAFAGREFVLRAYAEAISERYRFFSYGDCMLIL